MAFPKIRFQQKSLFANFDNDTVWQGQGQFSVNRIFEKSSFQTNLSQRTFRDLSFVCAISNYKMRKSRFDLLVEFGQLSLVSQTRLEICFPFYIESSLKRPLYFEFVMGLEFVLVKFEIAIFELFTLLAICTIFRLLASHRARHLF